MKPQVDPNLENIFLGILIDKLQKPEEWKRKDTDNDVYISTFINPAAKTYFETKGVDRDKDYKAGYVEIHGGNYSYNIHELKVNYKGRKLIRKLHEYMKLKAEWKKYEEIDNELKKALPENIDRYLKLTKIRKKL